MFYKNKLFLFRWGPFGPDEYKTNMKKLMELIPKELKIYFFSSRFQRSITKGGEIRSYVFFYILKAVFENLLIIFLCFYEFFNYLLKSIDCNRHLILPNQQKVAFYLLKQTLNLRLTSSYLILRGLLVGLHLEYKNDC